MAGHRPAIRGRRPAIRGRRPMREEVIDSLMRMNGRFYREQAASFSATRQAPWPGWSRCAGMIASVAAERGGRCRLFDLACGNLRFEAYLARALPEVAFEFHAVDACDPPACAAGREGARPAVRFRKADVVAAIRGGAAPEAEDGLAGCPGPFDVVASFGFLHHVPTHELRARLLGRMVGVLRPKGLAVASFWGFADDERLARKARETTPGGLAAWGLSPDDLEADDFLLGWQDVPGAFRYCHSFSSAEVGRLASEVCGRCPGVRVASRYRADGRSGALNEYVVFGR